MAKVKAKVKKGLLEAAQNLAIAAMDLSSYQIGDGNWDLTTIDTLEDVFVVIARPTCAIVNDVTALKNLLLSALHQHHKSTEDLSAASQLLAEVQAYMKKYASQHPEWLQHTEQESK